MPLLLECYGGINIKLIEKLSRRNVSGNVLKVCFVCLFVCVCVAVIVYIITFLNYFGMPVFDFHLNANLL